MAVSSTASTSEDDSSGQWITIYFGSQTGTAEAFSTIIENDLTSAGLPCRVADLAKFEAKSFRDSQLVVLVLATTGEGDPTDNAQAFNKFLASKSTSANFLSGLKYAIFGLGDLNYLNFNGMAKRTESNLDRLGASRIYCRGVGDASQDIEEDLRTWIDGGLIPLLREHVALLTPRLAPTPEPAPLAPARLEFISSSAALDRRVAASIAARGYWELRPTPVLQVRELRQVASPTESTVELVLLAPPDYVTCDTIEILPRDDPAVVAEVCALLGVGGAELIGFSENGDVLFPSPCSLAEALSLYVDVSAPAPPALLALHPTRGVSTLDWLRACPVRPSPLDFICQAPRKQPRPYTGSFPLEGGRVALTASLQTHDVGLGLCSAYICQRVRVGDSILVRMRPSHLRPTPCPNLHFLGIAAGAGLAPILAYLDWYGGRAAQRTLLFGCRDPERDLIHHDRLERAAAEGVAVHLAFSQAAPPPTLFASQQGSGYVQDLLRDSAALHAAVHAIERQGGRILVCGRTAMCRAVTEVLATLIGGQLRVDELIGNGILLVESFG